MTEQLYEQAIDIVKNLNPSDPSGEDLKKFFNIITTDLKSHKTLRAASLLDRIDFLQKILVSADGVGGYEGRGRRLLVTDDMLWVLREIQEIRKEDLNSDDVTFIVPAETYVANHVGLC